MKTLFTTAFLCLTLCVFGQSHIYVIKLQDISNAVKVKQAEVDMTDIFDIGPKYDPSTLEFTVKSDTDIDGDDFASKLAGFGYTVTFFKRDDKTLIED